MEGIFKNDGSFLERFKQLQQQQPNAAGKETNNETSDRKEEKTVTKPTTDSSNFHLDSKINDGTAAGGKGEVKTEESSSAKKSSFKMKLPSLKKSLSSKAVQDTPISNRNEFESEEEQKYDLKNGKGFRFSGFITLVTDGY